MTFNEFIIQHEAAYSFALAHLPVPGWDLEVPYAPQPVNKSKKKEGINLMDDKVYYLENRIFSITSEKGAEMKRQFGMVDDEAPRTPAELIQRIKDGKFTVSDAYKDTFCSRPVDYIRWRDPSVVEDKAGFRSAVKDMETEKQKALDIIHVKTADEGLAAMQAFEAWQPTVATATVN